MIRESGMDNDGRIQPGTGPSANYKGKVKTW